MFGVDFPEIIIICGVALVVLGPKKLPGAVAKIGRWAGRARAMAQQFREQLEQEISSVESAADIRKSVDSVGEPARREPPTGASTSAQQEGVPAAAEPVAHGTSGHEPAPHESILGEPYESGPYQTTLPPEGYGPAPQQLTFDAQLHDTALPPEGVPSAASAGVGSHPPDVREWMPETQTWMASAGWEVPESTEGAAPGSRPGSESAQPASEPPAPRQAAGERPSSHDRASEPAAATPASRTEAVEHDDR